jgi:hypothetical protein
MMNGKKPHETAILRRNPGKPADRSSAGWRNTIRLADGATMARKLNLTGYRWLKRQYASTDALLSTWPCKWTPRDFDLLFGALVIQANPGMSDDDAIETVRRTGHIRIHLGLLLRGGLGHDFT